MIYHCKQNKIKGLIVLIDVEKVFDSINWDLISKTLKTFNLGNNIINWIKSIQTNSYSYIVKNGHILDQVLLHRGCRQGDLVSPYVFVLAAKIMEAALRDDKNIEAIEVYQKEQTVSLYADDTTLYLGTNESNLRAALNALQEFQVILGLKVNIEKTKIIKNWVWGDSRNNLCQERNLIWTIEFVSLGITFNIDRMNEITENNMEKNCEINKINKDLDT